MKGMTRLLAALVLAMTATGCKTEKFTCLENGQCDDSDPCTDDVCEPTGDCASYPVGPTCGQTCNTDGECEDGDPCTTDVCGDFGCETTNICVDGPLSGDLFVGVGEDGSGFVGALFDFTAANEQYLDDEFARLSEVAVGECKEVTPPGPPTGQVVPENLGNVQVLDNGTIIVDMQQGDRGTYEESMPAGTFLGSKLFDFKVTGSAKAPASTATGAITIPEQPAFTGPVDGNDALTLSGPTIPYAPNNSTFLRLLTNFYDYQANKQVSVVCRLDGTKSSITLPQAIYDKMPPSGSIRIEANNAKAVPLPATDQPRGALVQARRSDNKQYAKSGS